MWKRKLIFSSLASQLGLVVKYLDVGARGDVTSPWSSFAPAAIKVIGFEPDAVECERLTKAHPARRYYPNALWGAAGTRPFYLCKWGPTSSMYPPNELRNEAYLSQHWLGRVPIQTIPVECVTLDSVLEEEDSPDFMKIDTQGAELEILRGAENLLRRAAPIVLAETWCTEVYSGMPLSHDVMKFMYELGYEVFDLNLAAAWQHRTKYLGRANAKSRTIGFDLLFMKRLDLLKFKTDDELLKFAGLCELFGFRDYAIAALETHGSRTKIAREAIAHMLANDEWERSFQKGFKAILVRILRRSIQLWPPLH
jgi:FkbM family methyltransferase